MSILSRGIQKIREKLELYECIGFGASLLFGLGYLLLAPQVDAREGAGWSEKPFLWIWGIYREAIPPMLLVIFIIQVGLSVIIARQLRTGLIDGSRRFLQFARHVIPFCLLLIVYRLINFDIPVFEPHVRDSWLIASDHFLLGTQPSVALQPYIRPWLTHLMQLFYSSWFYLIFLTVMLLQWRGERAIRVYLTSALMAFYLGYIGYLIIPAVGPYYTLDAIYHVGVMGEPIKHLVASSNGFYDFSITRDCFPSLHTAISCVMLYSVYKYQRKWTLLYFPLCIGILCSTIYLRWHYFTDVLAGIALAILVCAIGEGFVSRWNRVQGVRRSKTGGSYEKDLYV